VIVDTSCHLADFNLEVIESAQHILVVTALTIPAIKDAKLALKVLESLTVDPSAVLLVVDRSDSHSDFNKDSIEQNLRHSVGAQIPYDPRVVGDSINRGIPFVTSSPESDISRSIRELAGALVPSGGQPVGAGVAAGKPDDKRKRRIFGR
jgi:pilus assembly protein CpaE